MKNIILLTSTLLSACSAVTPTPVTTAETTIPVNAAPEQANSVTSTPTVSEGLSDLNALTFICPQAGLNAAAREAAKVPTLGRYQFSYFNLTQDSHHSFYEVHFKSNHHAETDLQYCVSVYCQQGQEPQPTVSLIKPVMAGKPHSSDCGAESLHGPAKAAKRRLKKK